MESGRFRKKRHFCPVRGTARHAEASFWRYWNRRTCGYLSPEAKLDLKKFFRTMSTSKLFASLMCVAYVTINVCGCLWGQFTKTRYSERAWNYAVRTLHLQARITSQPLSEILCPKLGAP